MNRIDPFYSSQGLKAFPCLWPWLPFPPKPRRKLTSLKLLLLPLFFFFWFLSLHVNVTAGDERGLTLEEYLRVNPPAPVNLEAHACQNSIRLKWAPPPKVKLKAKRAYDPSVDYYVIYRKDGTMPFQRLASTRKTTYEDKTVIKGNVYIYAVTAMQKDGNESGFSNEANITFQGVTGGAGIGENEITAMAQSPTLRPLVISRQLNPPGNCVARCEFCRLVLSQLNRWPYNPPLPYPIRFLT